MPYIPQAEREAYEKPIQNIVIDLILDGARQGKAAGHFNYVVSTIAREVLKREGVSYTLASQLLAALDQAKMELYRTVLGPYEDRKRVENGDCVLGE